MYDVMKGWRSVRLGARSWWAGAKKAVDPNRWAYRGGPVVHVSI